MKIHIFGAATPSGQALLRFPGLDLVGYSRNATPGAGRLHPADLNYPARFQPAITSGVPSIWVSFAPIWLFASFLQRLAIDHPDRLRGLCGVIATSSSSTITKRFASNVSDRDLVSRLITAEEELLATCRALSLPCRILQPTLIYGQVGSYSDRNLSILLHHLRRWPVMPLPAQSGLRQPIHATQLASVVLHLAKHLAVNELDSLPPERIALGGDTTLSYAEMISALQKAQRPDDPARRCYLFLVPNRLLFFLAAPVLIFSPKAFEAFMRMGANLSGFTPAHVVLGSEPQSFPVLPYT